MRKSNNSGFTLIELVIVIVLVGVIGSMAATMLFQGADFFVKETNRQGFVSESRIAFWKLMRESQSQSNPASFVQSDQNSIFLKNARNVDKDFQLVTPSNFNMRIGSANYSPLSSSITALNSNGFFYYDNNFNLISPAFSGMSIDQANSVHLLRLEMKFKRDQDELSLKSFIFPNNFRFGQKMSYHE